MRTGSNGAFGSDTLLYSAGSTRSQRIRYRQLAFVEAQRGDDELAQEGAWFFAAPAGDSGARNWAQGWRRGGKLVRLWQFNAAHFGTDPPPSYPATDHPDARWYVDYCDAVDQRKRTEQKPPPKPSAASNDSSPKSSTASSATTTRASHLHNQD